MVSEVEGICEKKGYVNVDCRGEENYYLIVEGLRLETDEEYKTRINKNITSLSLHLNMEKDSWNKMNEKLEQMKSLIQELENK